MDVQQLKIQEKLSAKQNNFLQNKNLRKRVLGKMKGIKQPDFVEFQLNHSDSGNSELQTPMAFSRVREVEDIETINRRKSVGITVKKKRATLSEDEIIKLELLQSSCTFPISLSIINLLRDPKVIEHEFQQLYLTILLKNLAQLIEHSQINEKTNTAYILYLHLILAQVENFQQLEIQLGFNGDIVPFNHNLWNQTNVLNTNCLLANLNALKNKKLLQFPLQNGITNNKFTQLQIKLIRQPNICIVANNQLHISQQFIEIAYNTHGHWDIYFAPFLIDKFDTIIYYRYLSLDQNDCQLLQNYSKIFVQLCNQYLSSVKTLSQQNWYENQLQKLINQEFSINEIEQLVYSGVKNPDLEKLLIGLMGWKDDTQKAIMLLNCYYDSHDWQSNDVTRPVVCQVGENFAINYLIENSRHREKLVLCLKAPCFNSLYNHYYFSFHKPKLNEYSADKEAYLWVQEQFGKFKKTGFYDWILYFASKEGKQTVNKIINIAENQKIGSQIFNKSILKMKNVKGRFIIHPQKSRKMQIHQVFIDSILSDEGSYKSPTFQDVINEAAYLKNSGVNTIFLSGVFQRDNGEFQHGFKRPQASPVAITNRTLPSSFLGGEKEFKKLVHYLKQNDIKLIVDCFTRVSSSRMSKKYEKLKLMTIDDKGRKNYFYGSEGRGMNYEQTAILNYRKKQAWDLLLNEVFELIEKYQIDGIHLDNGHVCPQIYEMDKEQLSRIQNGRLIYTHEEIFQGHVINPKRKGGYWSSKATDYPNPFFVYLTQNIWNKYPHFSFICETYETQNSTKFVNSITSGFIPRLFRFPKALSQIVGIHLHENGSLSEKEKKPLTKLAKWYEETKNILPKNSIIIQSTTNHIYPYPALIFKKATWAFIDLFFFLPEIPMTFSKEYLGRAYRTKALNMFIDNDTSSDSSKTQLNQLTGSISMSKKTSYSIVNSTFFEQENFIKKKEKITTCTNTTLRDPSQIKYLGENFRKEVGPEFGFDLAEIHRHYEHRRSLRDKYNLLSTYRMISISAEHLYGIHTNVISFAKYDDKEIMLISTNFNETAIDMHYNLTPLKVLFANPSHSDLILLIEDVLNPSKFVEQYYTVGQILGSKIEENIKAYSSSMWKISVLSYTEELMKKAFLCSQKRMAERISRNPPQWIYSSIFTNELSRLIVQSKTLKPFVNGLNKLYNEFITPMNLNFNLVISKTHELFVHKVKLQKLFGILKLLQANENKPYFEVFEPALRKRIEILLKGNELGPIAFVTPEIGAWSSVGGLGVMVDQLSKQLVKLKQTVYVVTPYYEYNKKKQTGYLARDGFKYDRNIKVYQAHFQHEFGIHRGVYEGVNYIWFHNPELFSRPYDGDGAMFVTRQMVFFSLISLEAFCQLQIFPSIVVTNDWMCGFVSAYVKVHKFKEVFNGTKFIHIVHNLDPLYEGRLYPKYDQGDLNWLVQLPREWYLQHISNKMIINPSKCALETCDNWGTVSHSYKIDLLKESPLSDVLWKHPHAFSFPNGVRKDQRISIIHSKTPGDHLQCKKVLQQRYFGLESLNENIPLFAFIGRVTKQKGVHLIIDAIESLLQEFQHQIQFLIGGPSDSKEEYGKYCADRMKYLNYKYPKSVWCNPDAFFTDGALVNVGSDYAMMPSLFEPGGIVQHQFFCGSTPVIAFRTGGLKDSVFEFDMKTKKGNGFNFMSYDVQDFKRCMRRAINCFKNKELYQKLRENAFESVIEVSDVARGWNSEFYRLQNKIYIDWQKVDRQIESFVQKKEGENPSEEEVEALKFEKGEYWKRVWQVKKGFKQVLKGASRLSVKPHVFCFQSDKIPRPKQVMISGTWNDWKQPTKLNFQKIHKNWKISLKLKPGTYYYKYIMDGEWTLTKQDEIETDLNNNQNHIIVIE